MKGLPVADINRYREIRLAETTVSVAQEPDWAHIFNDLEDTFALNRFGWLLTATYASPTVEMAQRALGWITNWIGVMGEKFHHPAWESYSVSERLSNWPFILMAAKNISNLDEYTEKIIAGSVETNLQYLKSNLELRGVFTNNHILNNARGLYIGGLTTGNEYAVEKAKAIFNEWTPKLFYQDGMLKENSSHYQLLLHQRFEQVYLLSLQAGDDVFTFFMKKWTEKMRAASDFFHVWDKNKKWTIPLMGDISPDFPPEWLSPLSGEGWASVKNFYTWSHPLPADEGATKYLGLSKVNGQFLRYSGKDITAFWHVPDDPVCISHGHFDTGSFVLFLKGMEIFSDPGRFSYSTEGSTGKYARAHSSLVINGMGAFCEDYRLNLVKAYPYQKTQLTIDKNENEFPAISMNIDGFQRLSQPVSWKRFFLLRERAMIIRDCIEAQGHHELETRFVIASGISPKRLDDGLNIHTENGLVKLRVFNSPHGIAEQLLFTEKMEISKAYGQVEQGSVFIMKNSITGNHENTYEIRWDS